MGNLVGPDGPYTNKSPCVLSAVLSAPPDKSCQYVPVSTPGPGA